MSAIKYNLKNPGVKRIMQEARELANENTYEYDAHPLEDNIFEWHFTVRGPKDTDFEEGRYHGRIILPNEYPFKPPELIFLTPNGRFELNTKICLSITGFHPEFWQPAWGIRTVLLAVIGFFPTEARGAIGGLDYTKEERQRLAKKSVGWVCPVCEVNTKDALNDTPPDIEVKREELPAFMITYQPTTTDKEQSHQPQGLSNSSGSNLLPNEKVDCDSNSTLASDTLSNDTEVSGSSKEVSTKMQPQNQPTISGTTVHPAQPADIVPIRTENSGSPLWLDALIAGLVSFLCVLICRKYVYPF